MRDWPWTDLGRSLTRRRVRAGARCPPRYDSKSDIWALGCVLYELTTLEPAFVAASLTDLWSKIRTAAYRPITRSARQCRRGTSARADAD